jgi:hypothetical protein
VGPAPRIRIGVPRRLPAQLVGRFDQARYVLYAGALVTLLAGIVAMVFLVPSAQVTLVAQAQPFSSPVEITAQPNKPPVHVRMVSLTKSASMGGQATGALVTAGQLASGQFTYVNGCPFDLHISNGQRLSTASGVTFAQRGDVQLHSGAPMAVNITATAPGQNANVGPGQITNIEANQFPCLTGTNQGPTAGGTDDVKDTVIQTSDLQGVQVQLEQQLRQQITDELGKGAQKGEKLAAPPQFGAPDFHPDHSVNDKVPGFTATMRLTAEGDYYLSEDLDRAFAAKLLTRVPAGEQLTTNRVVSDYTVTSSPGGNLDFNGRATGYVAPRIDLEKVRGQLVGRPASDARASLGRLPIREVDIRQSPFPLPLLPFSSSRIDVEYREVAPSTAPAAQTS